MDFLEEIKLNYVQTLEDEDVEELMQEISTLKTNANASVGGISRRYNLRYPYNCSTHFMETAELSRTLIELESRLGKAQDYL